VPHVAMDIIYNANYSYKYIAGVFRLSANGWQNIGLWKENAKVLIKNLENSDTSKQ
jgi:hypothetical protein